MTLVFNGVASIPGHGRDDFRLHQSEKVMQASPLRSSRLAIAIATFAVCCPAAIAGAAATGTAPVAKIPFVVGLTTVSAASTRVGDYEVLSTITSIDASGHVVVKSGDAPQTKGGEPMSLAIPRRVLKADQASARKNRVYFHTFDPESFPGTVPGFSAVVVNDLRTTGKTAFTVLHVEPAFFSTEIKGEYSGTLVRVVDSSPTLSVLVNGRNTPLPVLHAKGTLAGSEGQGQFEYVVLDDPSNPIVLRVSGPVEKSSILRIEYPVPKEADSSIESALAKKEVAEVYGIYFSFNRADIRPESERVLQEIAAVLKAHPDWKLRVDGHTDGIGNDAENLDLSKRRSAAVKEALVSRYGIDGGRLSTGGYGESAPQATNDTPEGRARNRRVELRRE
jgi:outer membrane protein OmpA-like peptidoglycan-associated protein